MCFFLFVCFANYLTLAFPKCSDFVVYPLHFPGARRKEDKRWAVVGSGRGSSVQGESLEERCGQIENKLSHLSWSQVHVLGLTLHAGKLHGQ